jgi:hypothetical protein
MKSSRFDVMVDVALVSVAGWFTVAAVLHLLH